MWDGIEYNEKQAVLWHNRLVHIVLYGLDERGRDHLAEAETKLPRLLAQRVPGNQKHRLARLWEHEKAKLARTWKEAIEVADGVRAPKLGARRDPRRKLVRRASTSRDPKFPPYPPMKRKGTSKALLRARRIFGAPEVLRMPWGTRYRFLHGVFVDQTDPFGFHVFQADTPKNAKLGVAHTLEDALVLAAKRADLLPTHRAFGRARDPKRRYPPRPKGRRKIEKVLGEFKRGKLKTRGGKKVRSRKRAIAIALSEQRRAEGIRSRDSSVRRLPSSYALYQVRAKGHRGLKRNFPNYGDAQRYAHELLHLGKTRVAFIHVRHSVDVGGSERQGFGTAYEAWTIGKTGKFKHAYVGKAARRDPKPIPYDADETEMAIDSWVNRLSHHNPKYTFGIEPGRKYVRIWKQVGGTGSRSAIAFVDREGNVYRADSWKKRGRRLSHVTKMGTYVVGGK